MATSTKSYTDSDGCRVVETSHFSENVDYSVHAKYETLVREGAMESVISGFILKQIGIGLLVALGVSWLF